MAGEFLNDNANRAYPFDELATLIDDTGERLPEGILVDLSLTIPRDVARRVYCSAITRTRISVSVVLAADNATKQSLAIVTLPVDGLAREVIPVSPLMDGVVGQVMAGEYLDELPLRTWRFASASQSYLLARCVYPIPVQRPQTFGVFYADSLLNGLVNLVATGGMEAVVESRLLSGQLTPAIILRLRDAGVSDDSVLRQYAGELQGRPESRTCGDPPPVETISRVKPDCCGRIFIELRGCARPIPINNHCGVVLDCPYSADELCPPRVNYDTQDDSQVDKCIDEGNSSPLIVPENKPAVPPWWGADRE